MQLKEAAIANLCCSALPCHPASLMKRKAEPASLEEEEKIDGICANMVDGRVSMPEDVDLDRQISARSVRLGMDCGVYSDTYCRLLGTLHTLCEFCKAISALEFITLQSR